MYHSYLHYQLVLGFLFWASCSVGKEKHDILQSSNCGHLDFYLVPGASIIILWKFKHIGYGCVPMVHMKPCAVSSSAEVLYIVTSGLAHFSPWDICAFDLA